MSITTKINRAFNLFGVNMSRVPSRLFHNIVLPGPVKDFQIKKDSIFAKKLNLEIPKTADHPILLEYHHAVRIVEQLKGVFFYDKDGNLKVKFGQTELYINEGEELFIISEVFLNGSYNLLFPNPGTVVVDIGMNVGFSSIFFSAQNNVEKIYAFELFPATHEKGLRNIALNPTGKKIQAFAYGLGKENKEMVLPYSTKVKGRMGINGLPGDTKFEDVVMQTVQVKKASDELKRIANESTGKDIVCKIDCEGAEYEIFDDLYSNGAVDKAQAYMIEWHYKKPDSIIKALQENRFTVFYLTFPADNAGALYAVQQR